ncbi:MAG: apolipoprotein N-acyltransferase [Nitrosomonadales bacterium]|nr:apolipoprotein N-acyltransferase [Nitrosomonadales bacterium]
MTKTKKSLAAAFAAGLLCVFGFAPFGVFVVPVLALAALFALWSRADSPSAAAWIGLSFGLGLFVAGIGWIYVALHDYGGMPLPLALPATLLFAAFIALFPALAGYAQARFSANNKMLRMVLVMPAIWALIEWLRGTIFTGFPWLTLGYAHSDSPLAGYAPLFGVYGVSLVAAVSAGLLAWMFCEARAVAGKKPEIQNSVRAELVEASSEPAEVARSPFDKLRANGLQISSGRITLAILAVLWTGGAALRTVAWTQPHGEPFSVALVQGNIAQDLKFNEDALPGTLETYRRLTLQNPARLTILPETALPLLRHEVPQQLVEQLRDHARENGGDILIGAFAQQRQLLQRRVHARHGGRAALPQTASGAVRRIHPAAPAARLAHQRRARHPDGRPGARRCAPGATRCCRPARRGGHLLRGRVRRRDHPRAARSDAAGQLHQRRLVRPFSRGGAAQPDLATARAGNRPHDAARHQHRRDLDHRRGRQGAATTAATSGSRAEWHGARLSRHHALCALGQRGSDAADRAAAGLRLGATLHLP